MGFMSWLFGNKESIPASSQEQANVPAVEEKEEEIRVIPLGSEQIRILEELQALLSVLDTELNDSVANVPNRFKMLIQSMKAQISILLNEKKVAMDTDPHLKDIITSFSIIVNAYKNYLILENIFDNVGRKIIEFEKSIGLAESMYKKKFLGK